MLWFCYCDLAHTSDFYCLEPGNSKKAYSTQCYKTRRVKYLTISSGGKIGSWDGSKGWNSSSSYSLVHSLMKQNTNRASEVGERRRYLSVCAATGQSLDGVHPTLTGPWDGFPGNWTLVFLPYV